MQTDKQAHTHTQTDRQTESQMYAAKRFTPATVVGVAYIKQYIL